MDLKIRVESFGVYGFGFWGLGFGLLHRASRTLFIVIGIPEIYIGLDGLRAARRRFISGPL